MKHCPTYNALESYVKKVLHMLWPHFNGGFQGVPVYLKKGYSKNKIDRKNLFRDNRSNVVSNGCNWWIIYLYNIRLFIYITWKLSSVNVCSPSWWSSIHREFAIYTAVESSFVELLTARPAFAILLNLWGKVTQAYWRWVGSCCSTNCHGMLSPTHVRRSWNLACQARRTMGLSWEEWTARKVYNTIPTKMRAWTVPWCTFEGPLERRPAASSLRTLPTLKSKSRSLGSRALLIVS